MSLLALDVAVARAVAPIGTPFRVNTETVGQGNGGRSSCGHGKRRTHHVASDGNEFIVVWQSEAQDGDEYGVYAQRYDAAGTPVGGEFRVHAETAGSQINPVVAKAPSGQFVVAWGSGPSGYTYPADVFARVFDASGAPLGPEFPVSENGYDAGGSRAYHYDAVPAVETDANGRFVVVWEREGAGEDGRDVMARRFDASGTALGGAFQVRDPGASVPYTSFYWNRMPDVA